MLASDIKPGAYYDPRLLADYGGPLFNHNQAKLVQRNIIDEDGNLTAPWLEYDKLCTGTVVLMRISLHTYSIPQSYTQKKVLIPFLMTRRPLIPFSSIKFMLTE